MRTISRLAAPASLLCLAVSVSGCPSDGGGGGGGQFRGFATAGLQRGNFGDSFEGSAVFLGSGIGDPGLFDAADGTCIEGSQDLSGSTSFQDAGETVDLVTAGGTLTLDALLPGIYISFAGADASLWTMGGTVTLTAPGGDGVGAFSKDFVLSGGLTVTSPDPSASLVIDHNADLVIAWTSSGTTDPIFVNLEQYDSDADETPFELSCKFDDDGSATLTAAQLADMSTDAALETTLSISKERITIVSDVPGLGGDLVGDGEVSYDLTATTVQ